MLAAAAHALRATLDQAALDRIELGAFVQLGAACAGLAVANRAGLLNLIAGAMILAGATLFASALYALSLLQADWGAMLAPVGGVAMILGWLVIAFARPKA
jgi:uncharacterized membrane protein YgdD (TMEM256/DUF423 family)